MVPSSYPQETQFYLGDKFGTCETLENKKMQLKKEYKEIYILKKGNKKIYNHMLSYMKLEINNLFVEHRDQGKFL